MGKLTRGGDSRPVRGRGASYNPGNRFERITVMPEADPETKTPDEASSPQTHFLKDTARSILATNDSPDVGFRVSINPYRGCEHGCIYCYARPTHEYLGFSAGLDFETRILVKEDAPVLLRQELSAPAWKPEAIAISGVTDPYQPIERRLQLTRRCLQVLAEFRQPVVIITKNALVIRDKDWLAELASCQAAAVFLSVTTLDDRLRQSLEPRASHPDQRLAAIQTLSQAGIPAGVLVAPVIPGLTDHEIPSILSAAAQAGAQFAGYGILRLPLSVAALFSQWLTEHVPAQKNKVLNRIRSLRGGRLNDPDFITRMTGNGPIADVIDQLFHIGCRKAGLTNRSPALSTASFRRPGGRQLTLFE